MKVINKFQISLFDVHSVRVPVEIHLNSYADIF